MVGLALKNVYKISKNSFGLMTILIFTQIICGISLLFTYGTYENYICMKNDNKLHSRENIVSFTGETDAKIIIEVIDKIRGELPGILQTVLLDADVKDTFQIYATCNYEEPEEYYLDISGREYVVNGRFFTEEEMLNGQKVALTFQKDITNCNLAGELFDIVGYMNSSRFSDYEAYIDNGGKDIYYIPLYSIPKEAVLNELTFYTSRILSTSEEDLIERFLTESYGTSIQYQAGTVISLDGEENSKRNIVLSLFVSVLGAFNLITILGYIYNKRRRYYGIAYMLGMLRIKMFLMTIFEVAIITLLASFMVLVLFGLLLEPLLEQWYLYFNIIYSGKVYLVFEIYFMAVMIVAGVFLAGVNAKRCELVRGRSND